MRKKFEPVRGFQGDYSGTCVVCGQPTDTVVAFRGDAEFIIAGLIVLGVPEDEAYPTAYAAWKEQGVEPGNVPGGTITYVVRVCESDAADAGMSAVVPVGDSIPAHIQRED